MTAVITWVLVLFLLASDEEPGLKPRNPLNLTAKAETHIDTCRTSMWRIKDPRSKIATREKHLGFGDPLHKLAMCFNMCGNVVPTMRHNKLR